MHAWLVSKEAEIDKGIRKHKIGKMLTRQSLLHKDEGTSLFNPKKGDFLTT